MEIKYLGRFDAFIYPRMQLKMGCAGRYFVRLLEVLECLPAELTDILTPRGWDPAFDLVRNIKQGYPSY